MRGSEKIITQVAGSPIWGELEQVQSLSGHRMNKIMRDWVEFMHCALLMDYERHELIYREYLLSRKDQRIYSHFLAAAAYLKQHVDAGGSEILGSLWMELCSLGNNGQYMTPDKASLLLAQLAHREGCDYPNPVYFDPCCGSGRLLYTMAREASGGKLKDSLFIGVDIDRHCAQMAFINLDLLGVNAAVAHGNCLAHEYWDGWWMIHRPRDGQKREVGRFDKEALLDFFVASPDAPGHISTESERPEAPNV